MSSVKYLNKLYREIFVESALFGDGKRGSALGLVVTPTAFIYDIVSEKSSKAITKKYPTMKTLAQEKWAKRRTAAIMALLTITLVLPAVIAIGLVIGLAIAVLAIIASPFAFGIAKAKDHFSQP